MLSYEKDSPTDSSKKADASQVKHVTIESHSNDVDDFNTSVIFSQSHVPASTNLKQEPSTSGINNFQSNSSLNTNVWVPCKIENFTLYKSKEGYLVSLVSKNLFSAVASPENYKKHYNSNNVKKPDKIA